MHTYTQNESVRRRGHQIWRAALLAGVALPLGSAAWAQDAPETVTAPAVEDEARQDTVIVTGIRSSLESALQEKRAATNLIEVIQAEDIGKLPDQNLAEVLENITGVQITREAGVGTAVQIRGTNANRTEINGVSTVGSGAGRSGISFEDVPASMIAAVEVTKAPEAKTIEGSVGGTINLRTIRPLELDEDSLLANIRLQGEDSSLSTDGITPRISGTIGKKWTTMSGQEFGAVASLSYSEQDVTAFRPRVDRDNDLVVDANRTVPGTFPNNFLPIQFFIQDYDNFEYETLNFSGSLEWAPNDSLKFYFDGVVNDQERRQESSRVQASGISSSELSVPGNVTDYETINFGSLNGQDLGSIDAALRGIIPVEADGSDGNLRFSSDTNSRLTDSSIFRLGSEWERGRLSGRVEVSTSTSDSTTPAFNTTLNFINPNAASNDTNENGTPFEYDLTGGSLTWGILQDPAYLGPTTEQLLDPANVVLRDVNVNMDVAENSEDAFRADFSYDLSDNAWSGNFLTSVDAGYRYSETSTFSDQVRTNIGLRTAADSPTGDLFSELLVAGPDNFNSADGRALYVRDFLLIDPEFVASNPDEALAILNAAIAAHGGSIPISEPTSQQNAFFDITEKTNALYAQANFQHGIFRGNAGVRYLETDVTSNGNAVLNGVATPTTTKSSYDFVLPRFNLVADVHEDVIIRMGWGKDIRRPDFDDLSTSVTFSTSPNPAVNLGNANLKPEEVESFDISAEWYFAPSAVLSAGFFHKTRTGLFVTQQEDPATTATPANGPGGTTVTVDVRDTTEPCEGGGVFNPIADMNVFAPVGPDGNQIVGVGVCVPSSQIINGSGETTLKGVELAFQYDLSNFEDQIGWASGFGVVANFTHQKFSGGEEVWSATSRAADIFAATSGATNVELSVTEIDLSENSYNATLYYEKYGLSARARYTWRDAYRSTDFGSTSSLPWGFPVVQEARGQLNASINYDVTENFNIGIEGVNLTESEVTQSCVNEGSLLCFQGLTDRRITFGASYSF